MLSCTDAAKPVTVATSTTDGAMAHPSVASISLKIAEQPKNAALFFDRAKALSALNEDSLAINDLKTAVSLDSTKAKYMSAIGEILFDHKDIAGSVQWFKKAIALNPQDPVAHLKFAKMLLFVNDNQKAFNEINTVLRQDPYNPEAYFLKGMVYKNMNDTNKSISSFQTSVQVDPYYQPAILQLALIYAAKQDSVALQYFERAFVADSTDLTALYGKGLFYQDNGSPERAKATYKRCILKDSQYGNAYFNTGWILMHQDSLEKAAKQFDFVTKIEPQNPYAYYNRGLCYEMMKNKAKALADYKQALAFDPEYAEAKEGIKRLK